MYVLMALAVIDWIAMVVYNPINPITWVSLCTTVSFLLRRFGIHVPVKKIIPVEVLFLFLCFNGSLVFKTFTIKNYLILIVFRIIFYLIVLYDDTQYVYVQEEVEKEL